MHPSKVTLRPKVRRPMAWDSTRSAPSAQFPVASRIRAQDSTPRMASSVVLARGTLPGLTMMLRTRNARNSDGERVRQLVFSTLAEHGLEPDPSTTDADLDD